jgi:hypothetical protein
VAPEVLDGVEGTYCGRFDAAVWRERLRPLVEAENPRVDGRAAAARYSAGRMADRVYAVWHELVGR